MSFKDLEQKHNLVNMVILACGRHPTDADINPLLEERLERFYEDAVIEGMAKQMHSSVDRAVNAMAKPEQSYQESMYKQIAVFPTKKTLLPTQPEQESISTNDHLCAMLRQVHDVLACTALPMKRPWVGLTDDEIEKIVDLNTSDDGGFDIWCDGIAVAHIVCAKLKENNT